MNFTHVLVPTDLSPMAPHLVRYACEEAVLHQAKVTLLHVVASRPETVVYYVSAMPSPALRFDPILGGPLGMPKTPPPAMLLHDPQEEALQRLRDLIPASCDSACEIVVATGNPVALIVHMARARSSVGRSTPGGDRPDYNSGQALSHRQLGMGLRLTPVFPALPGG